MHIKGKLEYRISASNAIDIISKEDESVVVAGVMNDEDDLDILEIDNAKHLVKCWNRHDDLLSACKKGVAPNVIQEYIFWLDDRIKAPYCAMWRQQLKGLRRVLEIMLEQSDMQLQAVAKAEEIK
jgi:hypothetical protein